MLEFFDNQNHKMRVNMIDTYQGFIKELTQASGEILKKYFRSSIDIESKKDKSPVTIADRETEQLLRKMIMERFPDHGILGEEFGEHNPDAEYKWILDPIDGTVSFICGALSWGTLIGLLKNDEPILGVFHQPILNELLIGDNSKTILNGKSVKKRECQNISDAVLLTTDHFNIEKYQNINRFYSLSEKVKFYRMWGDCYGYYLLATGFADIMIDPIMSPWDALPIIPIIKGAGGVITDYQGKDAVTGKSIIAAGKNVHSQVIEILNK